MIGVHISKRKIATSFLLGDILENSYMEDSENDGAIIGLMQYIMGK
jgi:hypothetical protein